MTLRILLTIPILLLSALGYAQQAGPAYSMMLQEIADAPQADRIEKDITKLVGFGTRHTLSDTVSETRGIGAARRWIKEEFKRISADCGGCLEVKYVQDTIMNRRRIPGTVNIVNVIAIQRGTSDPDRIVMMSGDIDSRVSDPLNGTDDSPGANDNASGVAGAMEAARVLSKYKFPGTIVYAALSGEEQGLFGGQILAEWANEQGWKIKGVLNNDMIGNIEGINGVVNNSVVRCFSEGTRAVETEREGRIRRFTGGEVDSPSRNLARFIDHMADQYFPNLDVMMIYRLDRFGRGGHHRPFNDIGAPAIRLMETYEHYDRQHQDLRTENGIKYGDVLDKVDFDYAATVTGLNAVSMAAMASAPAPPKNVTIEGAVSANTTLKWEAAGNTSPKGYKVYWRLTTSPVWQYSRMVGDVSSYVLENVIIDNYFFGVSAVAEDGSESPVVFPGPAGSFGD
ncbi:MAG: M28 family peptidase [Cyclobacteriaceae bacterium]